MREHFYNQTVTSAAKIVDTVKNALTSNSTNTESGQEFFQNFTEAVANPISTIVNATKTDTAATTDSTKESGSNGGFTNRMTGALAAMGIFMILFAIAILVISIIGIVWAFRCGFTTVGILAIVGLLLGLVSRVSVNIGLAFFIIYLTAKNRICNTGAL